MGWSLADLNYFTDIRHLNDWLEEIIAEMKRERLEMEEAGKRR
jgi:hypothetical protein